VEWPDNKTDYGIMKLVREHINEKFQETSDPIKDMGVGKLGMFKALEKRGVRMWFGWGERSDRPISEGEEERLKTIENIAEITEVVDKLENVGFKVNEMSISRAAEISVKTVQVLRSQHVILECATEEDANILIDAIKTFSIWEYDIYNKSNGEVSVPINPEYHVWLHNLIENRKKYKKFI
jgi:hypothetical protein